MTLVCRAEFCVIRRAVVIRAGQRSKRGARRGNSRTGKKPQTGWKSDGASPLLKMSRFRSEEKLLFEPVAAPFDALKVVYAYPNEYTVGITSLGYQMVWSYLAMRPDLQVSRLFTDAHEDLPASPALLGFSISWELDYTNMFALLEKMGVPVLSGDRTDADALVFGGGPVLTANPEPYADFFDVILMGDGEFLVGNFLDAFKGAVGGAGGRKGLLKALAQVPGIYVPSLYHVEYSSPDGPISSIKPVDSDVPPSVAKQTYRGSTLGCSTVVSSKMAWEDIFMVEVVRSCPEMCRFCMASYLTLPFRHAQLEGSLIPALERGLAVTNRIGLLGASVTQHPEFSALLDHLLQPSLAHIRLSIASVRTNTVTPQLARALATRGTKSLTVAVESGSERVRRIVNKKLEQEDINRCAEACAEGGLEALKLYGMVGVPGETDEDVQQTVDMMLKIKSAAPSLRLTLGVSTFVPKSHTPFQWFGVDTRGKARLQTLEKSLKKQGIDCRPESYKWSIIQGLLSRGDRRLGALLVGTREYGDSLGAFRRAFKDLQGRVPPLEYYVHRAIPSDETLPWSHLQGPLPVETLVKHCQDAEQYMGDSVVLSKCV